MYMKISTAPTRSLSGCPLCRSTSGLSTAEKGFREAVEDHDDLRVHDRELRV